MDSKLIEHNHRQILVRHKFFFNLDLPVLPNNQLSRTAAKLASLYLKYSSPASYHPSCQNGWWQKFCENYRQNVLEFLLQHLCQKNNWLSESQSNNCGLYYKCFTIVIYDCNDSGQYYKTGITIIIDDPSWQSQLIPALACVVTWHSKLWRHL